MAYHIPSGKLSGTFLQMIYILFCKFQMHEVAVWVPDDISPIDDCGKQVTQGLINFLLPSFHHPQRPTLKTHPGRLGFLKELAVYYSATYYQITSDIFFNELSHLILQHVLSWYKPVYMCVAVGDIIYRGICNDKYNIAHNQRRTGFHHFEFLKPKTIILQNISKLNLR